MQSVLLLLLSLLLFTAAMAIGGYVIKPGFQ